MRKMSGAGGPRRLWLTLFLSLASAGVPLSSPVRALAQTVPFGEGQKIERVEVSLANPSADAALNQRVIDLVRRSIRVFPSDSFSQAQLEISLARVRRQAAIADTSFEVLPADRGGVAISVVATLSDASRRTDRGYLLSGAPGDLPVLFDRDGTVIVGKLESLTMVYGNQDAWYGRPDLFLAGNPLAPGNPAGAGASGWAEGFVQAGLYGLTPLTDSVYAYGGLSGILSGSAGQELFTDEARQHFGLEDAYVGIVGGDSPQSGDRYIWNLSVGRKRYAIGDGLILANTAANGDDRAALQSNPRWAADMLVLGQFRYNNTLVEAFYLDPDELPVVDSGTRMAGINLQSDLPGGFTAGAAYIKVLDSSYSYFSLTPPDPAGATLGRNGLNVYDARLQWKQPDGNLFASGEFAFQTNDNFDMAATAFSGEIGYQFADLAWQPVISYRYARFSGDDPATARFERWDPLYSGGNGEQWVQGINHFKLFQDSNLITHRLQVRLRLSPQVEIVPQFWIFTADSTTNLGGNPALSFLGSDELGYEANVTVKWFISPKVMMQGHVAATFPGAAERQAAGGQLDPWLSAMTFLRVAF